MAFGTHELRWAAKEAVQRAKVEMASGIDVRLRYAALELRQAMEALVYDRALAFKDDIPPDQYKTWQPRRLMGLLLHIDPTIGFSSTISVGVQPNLHTPAPPEAMRLMGTDRPLTLQNLKDHYDALGAFLHMPSLEQLSSNTVPNIGRLRARCDSLVSILDAVLASRVWNSTLGNYATLAECANENCKQPIQRRLPLDKTEIETQCFACKAEYTIKYSAGDHKTEWIPKQEPVKCVTPDCGRTMHLWPHEIKPGTWWTCRECGVANEIVLSLAIKQPDT